MSMRKLTRCPYTLRPIEEIAESSKEHIIPDALGGPDSYSVGAAAAVNNTLGHTVDAAFLANPLIQMQRSKVGIKSRSGVADWKMSGETIDGGRPVDIIIPHEGDVDVRHKKPVDKNADSYTIIAPPEQSDKLLNEIKKNLKRKGKQIAGIQSTQIESQELHARLDINFTEIQSGMMKIAYLACCDYLGDEFLDDPLNPEWQKAIRAQTVEASEDIEIHGRALSENDAANLIFPKLAEHEHCIVILKLRLPYPIVGVRLFGDPFLSAIAVASESDNFGLCDGEGLLLICDSKTGNICKEPWINHRIN